MNAARDGPTTKAHLSNRPTPQPAAARPPQQGQTAPTQQAMGRIQPAKKAMPAGSAAATQAQAKRSEQAAQARAGLVSSAAEARRGSGHRRDQARRADRASVAYGASRGAEIRACPNLRLRCRASIAWHVALIPFSAPTCLELVVPSDDSKRQWRQLCQPAFDATGPNARACEPAANDARRHQYACASRQVLAPQSVARPRVGEIQTGYRKTASSQAGSAVHALVVLRVPADADCRLLLLFHRDSNVRDEVRISDSQSRKLWRRDGWSCWPARNSRPTKTRLRCSPILTSKDAMLRLDTDAGFMSHFMNPSIDVIQRWKKTRRTKMPIRFSKKHRNRL